MAKYELNETAVSAQTDLVKKEIEKLTALRREQKPVKVDASYKFEGWNGPREFQDLFGDKQYLLMIHNMGKSCPYCTLWADGFIGFTKHIQNRCAFALVNNDTTAEQKTFMQPRGWNFPVYSVKGTNFSADFGFHNERGFQPGALTFKKEANGISFVSRADFGPGDLYCSAWHLFDLVPDGKDWGPKFSY